jgi:biotin carboxyl carrier protein
MDEQALLQKLRANPENHSLRRDYLAKLEQAGDPRAVHLRQLLRRDLLQRRLVQVEAKIASHELLNGPADSAWLDAVFPLLVRSPTPGRFYARPEPEKPPFVLPGDLVLPETVVGIVEAMKLFNEITAGFRAVVSEVLVDDLAPVEYGQVLIKLRHLPQLPRGG